MWCHNYLHAVLLIFMHCGLNDFSPGYKTMAEFFSFEALVSFSNNRKLPNCLLPVAANPNQTFVSKCQNHYLTKLHKLCKGLDGRQLSLINTKLKFEFLPQLILSGRFWVVITLCPCLLSLFCVIWVFIWVRP